MPIDSQVYPRAAAYLAQLPAGIESHPECLVEVDGRENLRRDFGKLADASGVPPIVRDFLTGAYPDPWMPEVVSVLVMAMARDRFLKSDDALKTWAYRDATSVFKKPLYKMLMYVISPTLIVMGSAKRWATARRGSTLVAQPVRESGKRLETALSLTYPPRLYDAISQMQLGQVFVAAIDVAGGKQTELVIDEVAPTQTSFVVSWNR